MSDLEFDRRSEIESLLADDETTLGRMWTYQQEGLSAKQMADREGLPTTDWVSNNNSLIAVLRDGHIPDSPSLSQAAARRVRSWLKSKNLSPQLRDALSNQESLLTSRAEDKRAQASEVADAVKASKDAEASATAGIYVYTLTHYLRYPLDQDSGKTLLKVGHSSTDAFYRASSQGRLTALPEDPILLRIYPVDASAAAEREFHDWLRDADHAPSRARRGGSEWFVTSTKFLDRVAKSKGLNVIVVNEFDVDDE